MMRLIISNRQRKIEINKELRIIIKSVAKTSLLRVRRHINYEVSLTLVDDSTIQKLNACYRNLDQPTDVLSFALEEGPQITVPKHSVPMLGEIVISVEKALAQSKEYGHSLQREMAFLTVHGMLHLLGYDHQTLEERTKMEEMQRQILSALGIKR